MIKRRLDQFKHENVGMFDLASIGITLALAIVIGYFGGKWIGGKLGNADIGSYIGFAIGVAAGFLEMFRSVARWNRQMERMEKQRREAAEQEQDTEQNNH
ncbi:MAG: AtpZ/AtpI family protein [Candidatus Poribacteria bacterium]|nr:AtpZ/AtpI family protein [Candidatus Poribacteria bacterium]